MNSDLQAAIDFLRERAESVLAEDEFGNNSTVIKAIRCAVKFVLFWSIWKGLERFFDLYWLVAAPLAIIPAVFIWRIIRRMVAK